MGSCLHQKGRRGAEAPCLWGLAPALAVSMASGVEFPNTDGRAEAKDLHFCKEDRMGGLESEKEHFDSKLLG